jgi:hypothetical protein
VSAIFKLFGGCFGFLTLQYKTIYNKCTYIVGKYKMHSLRNRPVKLTIYHFFLLVSKAGTNKSEIYRQCVYRLYIITNVGLRSHCTGKGNGDAHAV